MGEKNTDLLIKESKNREVINTILDDVQEQCGSISVSHGRRVEQEEIGDISSIPQAADILQLHHVNTPATGNCQVYAVGQSLAGSSLLSCPSTVLERIATELKEGCLNRVLIDFDLKFPHGVRKQTLLSLGRGYDKISAKESLKEFKAYLETYANSGSKLDDIVHVQAWGSNDTLISISTFLQREIYVMRHHDVDGKPGAICFVPEIRHKQQRQYSTSGEYPSL